MAKRGFFRSALDALIAAREKQAQHYVNNTLYMLGDDAARKGEQQGKSPARYVF